jgi:hypothetical protein
MGCCSVARLLIVDQLRRLNLLFLHPNFLIPNPESLRKGLTRHPEGDIGVPGCLPGCVTSVV